MVSWTVKPTMLLLAVALALSAGPVTSAPSILSPSGYVERGAPGPYTGPADEAIPPDWFTWHGRESDVHQQCGSLKLVFRNLDLREDADGWVHAQSQLFIQFQAVGAGSNTITRFSFSFGVTAEPLNDNPTFNCNSALPDSTMGKGSAGVYIVYYRNDYDSKDGFFVPIQTRNVPDGDYAAAVHAYTGNCGPGSLVGCTEVARLWARAKVKNCNGPSGPSANCPTDSGESVIANDHTMPWPIVLPGDGEQTNKEKDGSPVKGLTLEFAEAMINDTVKAYVNGIQVPLASWDAPERDDDLQPNNDDQPCTVRLRNVCTRSVYGPGYKWLGDVNIGDVIRVEGRDKNRNQVVKTMHYGVGTSGGAVELEKPAVDLNPLNGDTVEFKPGDSHEFNVRLVNIGGIDAHVNLLANYTEDRGLKVAWTNLDGSPTTHVVVPAGASVEQKLRADSDPAMKEALFKINAIAEYDVKGEAVQKSILFTMSVSKLAGDGHSHLHAKGLEDLTPTETAAVPLAATEGSPGPGLLAAFLALGLLAVLVRRRHG